MDACSFAPLLDFVIFLFLREINTPEATFSIHSRFVLQSINIMAIKCGSYAGVMIMMMIMMIGSILAHVSANPTADKKVKISINFSFLLAVKILILEMCWRSGIFEKFMVKFEENSYEETKLKEILRRKLGEI